MIKIELESGIFCDNSFLLKSELSWGFWGVLLLFDYSISLFFGLNSFIDFSYFSSYKIKSSSGTLFIFWDLTGDLLLLSNPTILWFFIAYVVLVFSFLFFCKIYILLSRFNEGLLEFIYKLCLCACFGGERPNDIMIRSYYSLIFFRT